MQEKEHLQHWLPNWEEDYARFLCNLRTVGQIIKEMQMNKNIVLWQPENGQLIPSGAKTPTTITKYAVQLSTRDKKQIVSAYESGHFEMAVTYLWGKTVTALKKELSTVGVSLLGEMIGKTDVDEDDDVEDILTTKDAIRLAEELGIVSSTDSIRLRHTYELITHFSQLETDERDTEEIDESEAIASLKSCIRGVLGRPKVEVAKKFIEFREALEGETLTGEDTRVQMLKGSPYFFHKLTVNVLMSATKKNTGAQLEHALANANILIPTIWGNLRETEKWQIGHTYAEVYADGKTSAVSGLKSALLKVKGFDFVPENLRSNTFVIAAEAVLRAHDGLNNFYNEPAPVRKLAKLGTTIPVPALPACITALLSVMLGNFFGVSWSAVPSASAMLRKLSADRWAYYLNNVFPSDARILNKLEDDKPRANWIEISNKFNFGDIEINNNIVKTLIKASLEINDKKVLRLASKLLKQYYGR